VGGDVWLVTGAQAVGKSTVAQLLAERLVPSVHLRGDVFRRMVVGGGAEIEPGDPDLASRLLLRYRLAADAARTYAAAGYAVVVQDVVIGSLLADAARMYDEGLRVVVLTARPDVVAAREAGREKTAYGEGGFTVEELCAAVEHDTPRIGLWVDTSDRTPPEVVDEILAPR
jgi:predicted kinase